MVRVQNTPKVNTIAKGVSEGLTCVTEGRRTEGDEWQAQDQHGVSTSQRSDRSLVVMCVARRHQQFWFGGLLRHAFGIHMNASGHMIAVDSWRQGARVGGDQEAEGILGRR